MLFKNKLVECLSKEIDVVTIHGHKDTGIVEFCGEDFIEFKPSDGTNAYMVRIEAIFGFCLANEHA